MREVSVFYIDEFNNTLDMLYGLSVILDALAFKFKSDGLYKTKEAIFLLSQMCMDRINALEAVKKDNEAVGKQR